MCLLLRLLESFCGRSKLRRFKFTIPGRGNSGNVVASGTIDLALLATVMASNPELSEFSWSADAWEFKNLSDIGRVVHDLKALEKMTLANVGPSKRQGLFVKEEYKNCDDFYDAIDTFTQE